MHGWEIEKRSKAALASEFWRMDADTWRWPAPADKPDWGPVLTRNREVIDPPYRTTGKFSSYLTYLLDSAGMNNEHCPICGNIVREW
jgi:hypothetical protein